MSDECAQILKSVNFVQFFAADPDVNADAICVVSHQFGLLCATSMPKAVEVFVQAIHQRS